MQLTAKAALALGLSVAPVAAQTAGDSAPVTAFVDVGVIPMDRERVLEHHTVLIRDGRIAGLGPAGSVRIPRGATRIDGRGKFLIPGLGDMHVHLGSDSAGAERRLFFLLASGVTTIRNLDYDYASPPMNRTDSLSFWKCPGCIMPETQLFNLRASAAAGKIWSPRIYTSGVSPWNSKPGRTPEPITEQSVAAYKAQGYDHIKIKEGQPQVDSIVAVARRVGIPAVGHSPADRPHLGFTSHEHLEGFPGAMRSLDDSLLVPRYIQDVQKAGVWQVPTLLLMTGLGDLDLRSPLYDRFAARFLRLEVYEVGGGLLSDDESRRGLSEGHRSSPQDSVQSRFLRRIVKRMHDAGVGLLLGTDLWRYFSPLGMAQGELHAFTLAGLTPFQAMLTGTRNVAEYFGTLESTGTVAVGKRADLVLLDANPVADIRNIGRVAGVMTGGRWLPLAEIERRLEAYVNVVPASEP